VILQKNVMFRITEQHKILNTTAARSEAGAAAKPEPKAGNGGVRINACPIY
jgi:hypothetical protein